MTPNVQCVATRPADVFPISPLFHTCLQNPACASAGHVSYRYQSRFKKKVRWVPLLGLRMQLAHGKVKHGQLCSRQLRSSPALCFPDSLSLPAWVMAKLSPDYCHSLLLTMSDEEKRKFLRTLEERPLLPATSSEPTSSTPAGSGTAATAPASSSAAETPHQLSNPMGENLATEDYGDTTSTAIPAAPPSVLQEATPPSAPQAKASAPAEPEPPAKAQQQDPAGGSAANVKRWQKEPEVKDPPPKPPSTPLPANQRPAAAKAVVTAQPVAGPKVQQPPPQPAKTPSASFPPPKSIPKSASNKAPPPPLVVPDTANVADGGAAAPTSASTAGGTDPTPINNRAPLLASDAPADRLGHVIMIPKASPLYSLFSCGHAGNAAANAVRPLFLTAQTRGMSPTYAETASGLAAERPLQPRSQGGIKPSRMTPGTNPAGRTPLGVRTGGAARGTNEPPLPLYRNRPLLGSDKHVALLPRLGWRNSTRRFFNHDARASASR